MSFDAHTHLEKMTISDLAWFAYDKPMEVQIELARSLEVVFGDVEAGKALLEAIRNVNDFMATYDDTEDGDAEVGR